MVNVALSSAERADIMAPPSEATRAHAAEMGYTYSPNGNVVTLPTCVKPGLCSGDNVLYRWSDGQWRSVHQPTQPAIYTAGYGKGAVWSRTPDDLFASAKMLNGIVLDIRYNPHSPRPEWTRDALCERFEARYEWLGATLGNRYCTRAYNAYNDWAAGKDISRKRESIDIMDMQTGLRRVLFWLETRRWSPILLCACSHKTGCHRGVIADALLSHGYDSREVIWCSPPPWELGTIENA